MANGNPAKSFRSESNHCKSYMVWGTKLVQFKQKARTFLITHNFYFPVNELASMKNAEFISNAAVELQSKIYDQWCQLSYQKYQKIWTKTWAFLNFRLIFVEYPLGLIVHVICAIISKHCNFFCFKIILSLPKLVYFIFYGNPGV